VTADGLAVHQQCRNRLAEIPSFDLPSGAWSAFIHCAPSACTVSTMASPGAATASGRGVSAARAPHPATPTAIGVRAPVFLKNGMIVLSQPWPRKNNPSPAAYCRHGPWSGFPRPCRGTGGGQPALSRRPARPRSCHEAGLRRFDTTFSSVSAKLSSASLCPSLADATARGSRRRSTDRVGSRFPCPSDARDSPVTVRGRPRLRPCYRPASSTQVIRAGASVSLRDSVGLHVAV